MGINVNAEVIDHKYVKISWNDDGAGGPYKIYRSVPNNTGNFPLNVSDPIPLVENYNDESYDDYLPVNPSLSWYGFGFYKGISSPIGSVDEIRQVTYKWEKPEIRVKEENGDFLDNDSASFGYIIENVSGVKNSNPATVKFTPIVEIYKIEVFDSKGNSKGVTNVKLNT